MSKKLIVVDLDKTLIPFDSFREYILIWLRKYPIHISFLIAKRKFRIISSADFKKKVVNLIRSHRLFEETNKNFAYKLCEQINELTINKITSHKTSETLVLILSASPNEYVCKIGEILGYNAQGSYFNDNIEHCHLYGDAKINYIKAKYPTDKFVYLFAISDGKSDLELLKLFDNYELLVPEK